MAIVLDIAVLPIERGHRHGSYIVGVGQTV